MHISNKRKLVSGFLCCPLLAVFCMVFISCSANILALPSSASESNTTSICQQRSCLPISGAHDVQVFVEPDAGSKVITNAIHQAQKSVWLEMYLLTSHNIISSLEEAAHRGLDVRVMLEAHPYGSGGISPTQTLDRLNAAGIKTETSSPDFALTHEKGLVIDSTTAFIMTANFTLSALGGSKTTRNREYGIVDTNAQDVQTVMSIFTADWNRTALHTINNPNIVVSPINSRADFETLMRSAKNSLLIEAEEMQDTEIEQELSLIAHHGVQVQVILPAPTSSSTESRTANDANNQALEIIKQAGVQVKESTQLYMHAKIIIVDGQKAFVGSENISQSSLNRNRELGVIVSDPAVLSTLQQTFLQDWSDSRST